MIITQPALLCLSSFWNRLSGRPEVRPVSPAPAAVPAVDARAKAAQAMAKRVTVAIPPVEPAAPPEQALAMAKEAEAPEPIVAAAVASDEPAPTAPADGAPLTANERRARAAALRALAFGRARRFDAAQAAFTDAARLDPALDLTRVPSFWSLERSAHEAAIAAYVAADRAGDAAVLRARVHSVYRPKPLRVRPAAAATS